MNVSDCNSTAKSNKLTKVTLMQPPGLKFRAVAFDMDGTLLDHRGELFPQVIEGIHKIIASGIKVFLNTGRMLSISQTYWQKIGLDTPLACCNGGYVGFPGKEPFYQHLLNRETVDKVAFIASKFDYHINYYIDDVVYVTNENRYIKWYVDKFTPPYKVADQTTINSLPLPTKALAIFDEEDGEKVLPVLRSELAGLATVVESSTKYAEILPPGVDKSKALEYLANWSEIPVNQWVAVGDGMNDEEMLKIAGLGIGISGGDPRLEKISDFMVKPLWLGGMAELLRYLNIR